VSFCLWTYSLANCQPQELLHLSPPRKCFLSNLDHTRAHLISLLQVSLLQHASLISSPASTWSCYFMLCRIVTVFYWKNWFRGSHIRRVGAPLVIVRSTLYCLGRFTWVSSLFSTMEIRFAQPWNFVIIVETILQAWTLITQKW